MGLHPLQLTRPVGRENNGPVSFQRESETSLSPELSGNSASHLLLVPPARRISLRLRARLMSSKEKAAIIPSQASCFSSLFPPLFRGASVLFSSGASRAGRQRRRFGLRALCSSASCGVLPLKGWDSVPPPASVKERLKERGRARARRFHIRGGWEHITHHV